MERLRGMGQSGGTETEGADDLRRGRRSGVVEQDEAVVLAEIEDDRGEVLGRESLAQLARKRVAGVLGEMAAEHFLQRPR